MRILCTGDAHLGRSPSRIPGTPEELSVGHVWQASVEWAIANAVDAVVLTGDMADNKNSYFEAFGALRSGIDRLSSAGIPVYAVAGNHDYDVFPRLVADMRPGSVTLLGASGTWSCATLQTHSGEEACLIGWSFPKSHCSTSPLDSFTPTDRDIPVIAVVHGDLDAGQNAYAPLSSSAMQLQPVNAWLLGHVHAPMWKNDSGASILYPGSLQPLDPGEPGTHGPWLITIMRNGAVEAEQLPLATLRYETVNVDVSDLSSIEQIESEVSQVLMRRSDELSGQLPSLLRVIYRLRLSGRSRLYRELKLQPWSELMQFQPDSGILRGSIDRVIPSVIPDRDLEEISAFGDPPAIVAKWLLSLKAQIAPEELLCEAREAVEKVYRTKAYTPLGSDEPAADSAAKLLIEQGELLLDELMSQKSHE